MLAVVPPRDPAFYNPLAEFKRDVMVSIVASYASLTKDPIRFADSHTGIGAGGIRIANEIKKIDHVYINDLNLNSLELAKLSIKRNGVGNRCTISREEANIFLSNHSSKENRLEFIDIDPFGSPCRYLDSAVRATRIGGIIALTATDGQVLCGGYPEVSLRKYGGYSLNTNYCHEIGIRLMLGSLCSASGRFDLGISPVFVHTEKHYSRIYATLTDKPLNTNGKLGFISQCTSCIRRFVGPVMLLQCEDCGSKCRIAGPLWTGELFDSDIIERAIMKSQSKRLESILEIARDEIGLPASYFITDSISESLRISPPPISKVIDELRKIGYNASRTILNNNGFRTDADVSSIYDVFRQLKS